MGPVSGGISGVSDLSDTCVHGKLIVVSGRRHNVEILSAPLTLWDDSHQTLQKCGVVFLFTLLLFWTFF